MQYAQWVQRSLLDILDQGVEIISVSPPTHTLRPLAIWLGHGHRPLFETKGMVRTRVNRAYRVSLFPFFPYPLRLGHLVTDVLSG